MSWTFSDSNDVEELRRRIMFLQSCISQRDDSKAFRPAFVPGKVILVRDVQSEMPQIFPGVAKRGEYECTSNQWGAISVKMPNGKLMGVRPSECLVVLMVPNEAAKAEVPA